jgi:adenine specific DNA methylase Mod
LENLPEIKERKGITYLQPSMNFNPGTLSYEPKLFSHNKPLGRKTKIKVYFISIFLIMLILTMMILVFT